MSRRDDRFSLAEAGVTLDEEGRPDGFQVGKSAAIADWQFRKEAAEFERLCAALRSRRWYKENRQRAIERARSYYREHREQILAQQRELYHRKQGPAPHRVCDADGCANVFTSRRSNARWCSPQCGSNQRKREMRHKAAAARPPKPTKRERYLARWRALPPLTCEQCGSQWCRLPGVKRSRFCSDYCRGRHKYEHSERGRSVRRPHTGAVTRAILDQLDDWTTFRELRRLTHLSKNTLSGTLGKLVSAGRVDKRGPGGLGSVAEYRKAEAA